MIVLLLPDPLSHYQDGHFRIRSHRDKPDYNDILVRVTVIRQWEYRRFTTRIPSRHIHWAFSSVVKEIRAVARIWFNTDLSVPERPPDLHCNASPPLVASSGHWECQASLWICLTFFRALFQCKSFLGYLQVQTSNAHHDQTWYSHLHQNGPAFPLTLLTAISTRRKWLQYNETLLQITAVWTAKEKTDEKFAKTPTLNTLLTLY
jgi:hypothetical protein